MYREITIPYPNPYQDKSLEIKEIINGTFTEVLFDVLKNGETADARYIEFSSSAYDNIMKISKGNISIDVIAQNTDAVAKDMPQIKQMSYLPFKITIPENNPKKIYYPPYYYKTFEKTNRVIYNFGDKPIVMPNKTMCLSFGKEGTIVHTHTDNYYLTVYGGLHKLSIPIGSYVYKWGKDFFVAKYKDEDNNIHLYLVNLENFCAKEITAYLEDRDFSTTGNYNDLIITESDIFNKEMEIVGKNEIGYIPIDTFSYLDSGNIWGGGSVIDGVWYGYIGGKNVGSVLKKNKENKYCLHKIKHNLGMFSSKLLFDYAPMYGHYDNNNVLKDFSIYRYNYYNRDVFYVTKLPYKLKKLKSMSDIGFITNYGDFFYDGNRVLYSYDFRKWLEIDLSNYDLDIQRNIYRIWGNFGNNIVCLMGYLDIDVNENGNYVIIFKGIEFRR